MPKERWVGYIKDYDGGTLMECYCHPGIDHLNIPEVLSKQKQFLMERIQETSR
jgi:histone acetyltransferase